MKILKLGKYQGRLIQQLNNTFKDVGFLISLLCPFHCVCLLPSMTAKRLPPWLPNTCSQIMSNGKGTLPS